MPAVNYRAAPEPQDVPTLLPALPVVRDLPATLGPATPTTPFGNRQGMPPANGPYGN